MRAPEVQPDVHDVKTTRGWQVPMPAPRYRLPMPSDYFGGLPPMR